MATPPAPASTRDESLARRLLAPAGSAAAVIVCSLALALRDPHEHGSWGFCPFREITGLDCPLCGGLRAVNDLARGQVLAALGSNLLAVAVVLPLATWLWGRWVADSVRAQRHVALRIPRGAVGPVLLGVAVVFAVLRNLPFAQGLAA